jgi:Arylsulfotransferase (ASST)
MGRFLIKFILGTILLIGISISFAQSDDDENPPSGGLGAPDPNRPVGLISNTDEATEGYILIPIVQSKEILLLSNDGRIVNIWESDYYPSNSVYLKENGNLLRTASLDDNFGFGFNGQWGFTNGRIEEVTWDNEVVWSFEYSSERFVGHHDFEILPNGNILMIAFERVSAEEAIADGRNPNLINENGEVWGEQIIEIDPSTNEIVWEWRLWDHLIQEFDEDAENYGVVAENPEKVDLNYIEEGFPLQLNWVHINAIDYNPELDQIMLSPRTFSEIWVIDHSISTEEAQGSAGDLLFRWGNPDTYNSGTPEDRKLYYQHDTQWIPEGLPGAGNVLIYNNGGNQRPYSNVIEITLPIDDSGNYIMEVDEATEPSEFVWEYVADPSDTFYSALISGAQRQANGNTLITEGLNGRIFEVNISGEIVWEYNLPPAVWAFRGERYNLPVFENFDLTQDLEYAGGVVWAIDCEDGSQQRLHQYLIQESATMNLFIDTHGDDAEEQWQNEVCAEHSG